MKSHGSSTLSSSVTKVVTTCNLVQQAVRRAVLEAPPNTHKRITGKGGGSCLYEHADSVLEGYRSIFKLVLFQSPQCLKLIVSRDSKISVNYFKILQKFAFASRVRDVHGNVQELCTFLTFFGVTFT